MYSFDSRVRFSETDRNGRITPAAVVDYFQDCSTFHSQDLGFGPLVLKERRLVWVLSYWQIIFDRFPSMGEWIRICTIPHEFRGCMGFRNFYLENEEGTRMVRANSLWTLLNSDTMRPCRIPQDMVAKYSLEEKLEMEYEPRKVAVQGEEKARDPIIIRPYHLDCNGHVNNGQYIRMAAALLPEHFSIGQLRAEYKAQAYLNDVFFPYQYLAEDGMTIMFCNEQKEPYLIAEFRELPERNRYA